MNPSGAHGTSQASHVTRWWRGYEKQPRDISQLIWSFDLSDVSFSSYAGLTRSQAQRSMSLYLPQRWEHGRVKELDESSGKLFIFHFLSCLSLWKISCQINTCLSACITKRDGKSRARYTVPANFIITSLSPPPHAKQFTRPQQSTTFDLNGVKR